MMVGRPLALSRRPPERGPTTTTRGVERVEAFQAGAESIHAMEMASHYQVCNVTVSVWLQLSQL